jgi:hypothetical protein
LLQDISILLIFINVYSWRCWWSKLCLLYVSLFIHSFQPLF